jgi:hypothetical protein
MTAHVYAIVQDGVVVDRAVGSPQWASTVPGAVYAGDQPFEIGMRFEDGEFKPQPEPAALAPERWRVLRGTITDRLITAGLDDAAEAALDAGGKTLRRRWDSRWWVWSDDATARALLTAIGADPAIILARDPDAP